jgi:regulator of chromosome condensation
LALQKSNTAEVTAVEKFASIDALQIDMGPTYGACVDYNGAVWMWGNNAFHQLGLGTSEPEVKTPRQARFPEGVRIVQVSCSRGEKHCHTHALSDTGDVYSWGDHYKG